MSRYPAQPYQHINLGRKRREGFKTTYRTWSLRNPNHKIQNNLVQLSKKLKIIWHEVLVKPIRKNFNKENEHTTYKVVIFGKDKKGRQYMYDSRLHSIYGDIQVAKALKSSVAIIRMELGLK